MDLRLLGVITGYWTDAVSHSTKVKSYGRVADLCRLLCVMTPE